MEILLTIQRDSISVCNEVRLKSPGSTPSNIGLKNLDERYRHIMQKGIRIDGGSRFTVTLPLLKASERNLGCGPAATHFPGPAWESAE